MHLCRLWRGYALVSRARRKWKVVGRWVVSLLDPLFTPERTGVLILTTHRGQNAVNGELGMGEDKPKSATKPVQVETLLDLDIFQCVLLPRRV